MAFNFAPRGCDVAVFGTLYVPTFSVDKPRPCAAGWRKW
jgi:hypothetical protein